MGVSSVASNSGGLSEAGVTMRVWRALLERPRLWLVALSLICFVPGWFSLPPLDRDESRFAQASKQMIETGDFIQIRYQEGLRNKKPAGIHWLQVAAVTVAGGPEKAGIWAYRAPSVLGAILAVLVAYWCAARLFGREAGFLGAAFLAATVSLTGETNISKTDCVLLLTVVGAQGALARIYLGRKEGAGETPFWIAALFWVAISGGILIKGPIQPMVVGLTIAALAYFDTDRSWLRDLRWARGALITGVLVLPWAITILIVTSGLFYKEAVGVDLLPKITRGMESHGAPPGYYTILSFVTFWPASLFLVPGLVWAWQERARPAVRFCLAWAIPSWIVFELVATKLPHYSLPTYPALAFLAAAALLSLGTNLNRRVFLIFLVPWAIAGTLLAAAIGVLPEFFGRGMDTLHWLLAVGGLVLVAAIAVLGLRRAYLGAALLGLAAAGYLYIGLLEFTLPALDRLDVSRRVAAIVAEHRGGGEARATVTSSGYAEPSLVFLVGTDTRLISPEEAAEVLAREPGAIAAIESRSEAGFQARVAALGLQPTRLAEIEGHAYSNGRDVTITLYQAPREPL